MILWCNKKLDFLRRMWYDRNVSMKKRAWKEAFSFSADLQRQVWHFLEERTRVWRKNKATIMKALQC